MYCGLLGLVVEVMVWVLSDQDIASTGIVLSYMDESRFDRGEETDQSTD